MKNFILSNLGNDNSSNLSYNNVNQNTDFLANKSHLFSKQLVMLFLLILSMLGYAQSGKDGASTITTANTVENRYSRLAVDVAVNAGSITISNIAELNRDGIAYLPAGFITNNTVHS